MADQKTVLVTGATGQQGGAVARRLLATGWKVRALTRNTQGAAAQALAKLGAELVTGDLEDRASLAKAAQGVHGVFSVQTPYAKGGVEAEERQGKTLADVAKEAEVRHFVYSSVGGAERYTGIPHFDSKWRIEEHIRRLSLPATFLRPVFFMENFNFPFVGLLLFLGALKSVLGKDKPLQMIATEDIGHFAALAFERREQFLGKAIELAGDSLTYPQMAETYRRVTGRRFWALPFPKAMVRRMPEDMSKMLIWFGEKGYQANIGELRKTYPELQTFETWLKKRSA